MYEGINCIREREVTSVQHIYNLLEQHPGRAMHEAADRRGQGHDVPRPGHPFLRTCSKGNIRAETVFPPNDHRNHRPRSWLLNGVKKIDRLRFLESSERTLGQAALQWLLADERVASTLPNIYEEAQLDGVCQSSRDARRSPSDELEQIAELYAENFGVEREEPKFKGTMELRPEGGRLSRAACDRASVAALVFFGRRPLRSDRASLPHSSVLRGLVNFLEDLADHRCGLAAAVHIGADIAFVERGEGELRLFRRHKSREPCRRPLLLLRSPLRGAGLACDLHVIETRLMGRAGTRRSPHRPSLHATAPSSADEIFNARFSRT